MAILTPWDPFLPASLSWLLDHGCHYDTIYIIYITEAPAWLFDNWSPTLNSLDVSLRINWPTSLVLATLTSSIGLSHSFTWVHTGTALSVVFTLKQTKEDLPNNLAPSKDAEDEILSLATHPQTHTETHAHTSIYIYIYIYLYTHEST